MLSLSQYLRAYAKFDLAIMPAKSWDLFIKSLALAFLIYWLHLSHGLNDWLGAQGFHLLTPTSRLFPPLAIPWPLVLWYVVLSGVLLMFFRQTVAIGCLIAASGFFFVTMCDPASIAALNMNFIFGFAVIFWSSGLSKTTNGMMSAWPAYLIRIYLVTVYFGSGWRKSVFGDWLTNPHTLVDCMSGFYATHLTRWLYPVMPLFVWTLMQYATVSFELGAPLLLLYPPLRKWGVLLGCLLHIGIALLMKDLFYFSFQMLTFYVPVLITISHWDGESSKSGHQSAI